MDPTDETDSLPLPTRSQYKPANGHSSALASNGYLHRGAVGDKVHHIEDVQANAWHKQSQPYKIPKPKRKGKRKYDSLLAVFCQWVVDHQIGLAVNLLMLLALTHLCFPRARRHTRKFFQLSYHNASSGHYTIGWDDLPLVFYWIVIFTGLRAAVMDYILEPLAHVAGIDKKKEKVRFAEQAWIFIYYTASWCLGMYLMYYSEYWFDLRHLWTHWPTRDLGGLFKWYYLVQFAFWLQQMIVVNIEERRKDYAQMFTHHIITSALIFTSYGYHQYKIGNMILCLMDPVDILLAGAKILKYLDIQPACDIVFGSFIVVWLVTRHVFYSLILWSLYTEAPQIIKYGCYWGPTNDLQGPVDPPDRLNHLIQPFLNPVGLVILLLWFVMIIRVAVKVIKGAEAEDSRSDDEASSDREEAEEETYCAAKCDSNGSAEIDPYEEKVGSETEYRPNEAAADTAMPPRLRKVRPSNFQPSPPPSRYQCLRQPNPRPFSSTARNLTRQRRIMFSWLKGPGANFRNPLPGSTNYLNAYDPNGRLVRATNRERRSDSEDPEDGAAGLSTEKNLQGDKPIPKESLDDLMPFPMNRQFRSQPVLSEDFRDEIYKRWQNGDSVRRLSADLQVEMRRVGAVIRLKAVEEQWKTEGRRLATPYARAMQSMLPVTPFYPNIPTSQHESINDLPVHTATLRQAFHPVSESRHFTRTDAGRVFDPELLPADARVPHTELVESAKDRLSGMGNTERMALRKERDKLEREREKQSKEDKRRFQEMSVRRVEPLGGRWEFRFRDVRIDEVVAEKDRRGVGVRYGVPPQDRKRGQVKIPKRVDCV